MFAHTTQRYQIGFYNQHLVDTGEHSVIYIEVMALRVQRYPVTPNNAAADPM